MGATFMWLCAALRFLFIFLGPIFFISFLDLLGLRAKGLSHFLIPFTIGCACEDLRGILPKLYLFCNILKWLLYFLDIYQLLLLVPLLNLQVF